jgi:hypothetical protein
MRKLIEQNGARVKTGWPVQLHRYEPDKLPDPADVIDCALIVNDRTDGVPRARLVVSNGASFDTLAYLTDIPAASSAAVLVPQSIPALPPPLPGHHLLTYSPPDTTLPARVDALERFNGETNARIAELERVIDQLNAVANAIRQTKGRT